MSVPEYYSTLRGILDELDVHQPHVTDLQVLKRYREDLATSNFLSGLDPSLVTQIRGQILGGDIVPFLSIFYSKVYRYPLDLGLL